MHPENRPDSLQEKARYDEHINELSSPEYMSYLDKLAAPVTKLLGESAKNGLDFGCGPVEGMRYLLEARGFKISSYDLFYFRNTKLINFSYDFVLCSEVVEHFFDPLQMFSLLNSCLKPGGILGVSSRLYPNSTEEFCRWSYQRDPTHVSFFSEVTVRWLAEHFGWTLLNLNSPIWIFKKD
ncbi:MAG: class I SAM-dependent methyltransferase [Bdellovibrionota bacterium]